MDVKAPEKQFGCMSARLSLNGEHLPGVVFLH